MKCPLKGKRNETSQMPQKVQQTSVDQRFSSIRNKCIHCGGDHAPGSCPTRMQPQGYQMYNSTGAGKVNNNASLSFSAKNGQPAAASMTPSSPVINSSRVPKHSSCAQEPWITPQVSPSTSQQNSYNITRFLMVLNHPSVIHGWRRYTPYVLKQGGLYMKCCYYV